MHTHRNSATWLRNEGCERCGSRDNKAVYDDGSTWCWGCKHYGPPKHIVISEEKEEENEILAYPNQLSKPLAKRNETWLRAYGLNDSDLSHFFVDELTRRHVFLHYEAGKLTYYEARSVTDEKPKCLSKGVKPIHIFTNESYPNTLVLTEDVVSALRVSRCAPAGSLFGSALSEHQLSYLNGYDNLVIWLDYDKTDVALEWVDSLTLLGYNVALVIEDRGDPKDLTDKDIRDNIADALGDLTRNVQTGVDKTISL